MPRQERGRKGPRNTPLTCSHGSDLPLSRSQGRWGRASHPTGPGLSSQVLPESTSLAALQLCADPGKRQKTNCCSYPLAASPGSAASSPHASAARAGPGLLSGGDGSSGATPAPALPRGIPGQRQALVTRDRHRREQVLAWCSDEKEATFNNLPRECFPLRLSSFCADLISSIAPFFP